MKLLTPRHFQWTHLRRFKSVGNGEFSDARFWYYKDYQQKGHRGFLLFAAKDGRAIVTLHLGIRNDSIRPKRTIIENARIQNAAKVVEDIVKHGWTACGQKDVEYFCFGAV